MSAYAEERFLRARLSALGDPTEYQAYCWTGGQRWEPTPARAGDREKLTAYLRTRERVRPIPEALSETDRARLRALGYLGDE